VEADPGFRIDAPGPFGHQVAVTRDHQPERLLARKAAQPALDVGEPRGGKAGLLWRKPRPARGGKRAIHGNLLMRSVRQAVGAAP
jgi:hypothetical protein